MGLILINVESKEEINLDVNKPLILGRGVVTGCTDKRVSRSHTRLTCKTDGSVELVALHSNPCFFTKRGIPPILQLAKNQQEVLYEGDCLGLLPHSFWYKISSKSRKKPSKKPTNMEGGLFEMRIPKTEVVVKKEKLDEDEYINDNVNSTPFGDDNHTPPNVTPDINNSPQRNIDIDPDVPSSSLEDLSFHIPLRLRKTRKLPVWMYLIDGQSPEQHCDRNNSSHSKEKKKHAHPTASGETENKRAKISSESTNGTARTSLSDAAERTPPSTATTSQNGSTEISSPSCRVKTSLKQYRGRVPPTCTVTTSLYRPRERKSPSENETQNKPEEKTLSSLSLVETLLKPRQYKSPSFSVTTTLFKPTESTPLSDEASTSTNVSFDANVPSENSEQVNEDPNKPNENSQNGENPNPVRFNPGRPICRYENTCYRKNVQHKQEYCHPGDEDYVPYENRPLCQYGRECYRKNITHKRQYRHIDVQDMENSQATTTSFASTAPPAPVASTSSIFTPSTSSSFDSGPSSNEEQQEQPVRHDKDRFKRKKASTQSDDSSTESRSPESRRPIISVTQLPAALKEKLKKSRRRSRSKERLFCYYYEDDPFKDPFSDTYSSDEFVPSDLSADDDDDDDVGDFNNHFDNCGYYYYK